MGQQHQIQFAPGMTRWQQTLKGTAPEATLTTLLKDRAGSSPDPLSCTVQFVSVPHVMPCGNIISTTAIAHLVFSLSCQMSPFYVMYHCKGVFPYLPSGLQLLLTNFIVYTVYIYSLNCSHSLSCIPGASIWSFECSCWSVVKNIFVSLQHHSLRTSVMENWTLSP